MKSSGNITLSKAACARLTIRANSTKALILAPSVSIDNTITPEGVDLGIDMYDYD